jgi:hypothetical protein
LSSEASNWTSPLVEAVSKVEPEFEVLEQHKKLSSPQVFDEREEVANAFLIRYN